MQEKMDKDIALNDVTVCPGCDMILATDPVHVPFGSHLACPRCKYKVRRPKKDTVNRTLALSLTGLILYVPAHFIILLTFDMFGVHDNGSIFDSVKSLFLQKYGFVSLIVILTAQVFPLLKLGLLFLVTLGISRNMYVTLLPVMLRWYHHLEEWGMSEVYLIGVLVTIIKMDPTTRITYEIGFLCFVGLVIIMTGISFAFDKHHCWEQIEVRQAGGLQAERSAGENSLKGKSATKAIASGLIQCHTCHKVLLHKEQEPGHEHYCPRCGAKIHWRIIHSVSTTLALVLTALVLSLPANILPIMEVELLGVPEKGTIMDGIIHFFQSGSYGIGLIILSASILVPVFKILGLSVLLYSIKFRRVTRLLHKAIMFRFIAFIGRWSMLDIFVIALLCSLVNLGFFTTIKVAAAATFFTCVVLATMFATISFDERLLWDVADLE